MTRMETLPLSNRLFKETHKTLMQGVRGKFKLPGEYRTSQNWIGLSLKNATFVPPYHEHIVDLMSDLEQFIHNDEIHVPHLIKIAIIHYQFETIHPFLDGNGRLGRLLIVLYLVETQLISKPALYLSDFFERHKVDYYDRLMAVRTHNQLTEWIKFFMFGLSETAEKSINVFKGILILKEKLERKILPTFHVKRQENVQKLMAHLYKQPVINIKSIAKLLSIQTNTANKLVLDFSNLGILRELTGKKRNKLYIFNDYVKLFIE
ncbi:MAG: Fic family protein [Methylococcales bacterium]|nr:Fic family protein [Methylococcales bacterium]